MLTFILSSVLLYFWSHINIYIIRWASRVLAHMHTCTHARTHAHTHTGKSIVNVITMLCWDTITTFRIAIVNDQSCAEICKWCISWMHPDEHRVALCRRDESQPRCIRTSGHDYQSSSIWKWSLEKHDKRWLASRTDAHMRLQASVWCACNLSQCISLVWAQMLASMCFMCTQTTLMLARALCANRQLARRHLFQAGAYVVSVHTAPE